MDALSIVEDEVRELVRRRGLDPAKQPEKIRSLIGDVVRDYDERALLGAVPSLGSSGSRPTVGIRQCGGVWCAATPIG